MKIVLSCDENPGDPGAVDSGIVERTLNIACCNALKTVLERCGQTVLFDAGITFQQRVAQANSLGVPLLVAIAHNAAGDSSADGAQFVFCASPSGHRFGRQDQAAQVIGDQLVADGIVGRWSTYDENVYECCSFNGDTVYLEAGFETNPRDAARMKDPAYPSQLAESMSKGLAAVYQFGYVPAAAPRKAPAQAPEPGPRLDPTGHAYAAAGAAVPAHDDVGGDADYRFAWLQYRVFDADEPWLAEMEKRVTALEQAAHQTAPSPAPPTAPPADLAAQLDTALKALQAAVADLGGTTNGSS